jgi:hypothetical protein
MRAAAVYCVMAEKLPIIDDSLCAGTSSGCAQIGQFGHRPASAGDINDLGWLLPAGSWTGSAWAGPESRSIMMIRRSATGSSPTTSRPQALPPGRRVQRRCSPQHIWSVFAKRRGLRRQCHCGILLRPAPEERTAGAGAPARNSASPSRLSRNCQASCGGVVSAGAGLVSWAASCR